MTRVNLLRSAPAHQSKAESSPDRRRGALACVVILTVTSGGLLWWGLALHRHTARVDGELARTRHDLVRLRMVAADSGALERASHDIQERIDVLLQLRMSQRAVVSGLEALGRAVPRDCWLTGVTDDGPGVRIDGRAPALSSLFQFVERLGRSGAFRSVDVLDSRATSDAAGADVIAFSLIVSFHTVPPGAGGPGVHPPPDAVADDRSGIERSR